MTDAAKKTFRLNTVDRPDNYAEVYLTYQGVRRKALRRARTSGHAIEVWECVAQLGECLCCVAYPKGTISNV